MRGLPILITLTALLGAVLGLQWQQSFQCSTVGCNVDQSHVFTHVESCPVTEAILWANLEQGDFADDGPTQKRVSILVEAEGSSFGFLVNEEFAPGDNCTVYEVPTSHDVLSIIDLSTTFIVKASVTPDVTNICLSYLSGTFGLNYTCGGLCGNGI